LKLKMKKIISILFLILNAFLNAQTLTQIALADMPKRMSNNPIAAARVNGQIFVYTFGGLDSTKLQSGIHKKSFKFNVSTNTWSSLPDLPDANGKLAACASTVKNKIYIIGGYYVQANGNETSSNFVHVFDPSTDTYLPNATNIPIAIDDQSQVVWRDSLIYVITGWSNTTNVSNVQILDAQNNNWLVGTAVPNNTQYKVFGSSATIIGDTIYYVGGASTGTNFPLQQVLRKGVINPVNPTQITWSTISSLNLPPSPFATYRNAVFALNKSLFAIGGSAVTYNYNGLSYNNGAVVSPTGYIQYGLQIPGGAVYNNYVLPTPLMDLRNVVQIDSNAFLICGGMTTGATVINKTFRFDVIPLAVQKIATEKPVLVYPNPVKRGEVLKINKEGVLKIELFNAAGKLILLKKSNLFELKTMDLKAGNYFLNLYSKDNKVDSLNLVIE
jgi:Secretion system C-terminal sorting domain/Kelch motif/Galactose oxidase, central domain